MENKLGNTYELDQGNVKKRGYQTQQIQEELL